MAQVGRGGEDLIAAELDHCGTGDGVDGDADDVTDPGVVFAGESCCIVAEAAGES